MEKWFPIGSKGREPKRVAMVAQQIKTVDFAAGIEFDKSNINSRSAIGMQQTDKFSNKIAPLLATGDQINADLPEHKFTIHTQYILTRENTPSRNNS